MFESLSAYNIDTPYGTVDLDWSNPGNLDVFLLVTSITSGVDVRRQIESMPRADGAFVGDAYADARVITITGRMPVVGGGTVEGQRIARNQLKSQTLGRINSLMRRDGNLRWHPAGMEPLKMRVRRFEQPLIEGGPHKDVLISLIAPDPKAYSQQEYVAAVGVNLYGLAFTDPTADPIVTNVQTTEVVNDPVVNKGNAPTYPRIIINGPITGPVLDNITTGEHLSFPGLVVPAGETLDIDMEKRIAYRNGNPQFSVYSFVDVFDSTFFALIPDINVLRLTGTAADENTHATLFWNSAYFE